MKSLLLSGLCLVASMASAHVTGLEAFSSSTKNTTNWGADIQTGTGVFSQSGGVLRFSSASATGDNDIMWPYAPNMPAMVNSWSIQLDVNVPSIPLADGYTAVGIGLGVRHTSDYSDSFAVNLENVRSPGEAQEFNFYNRLKIDGVTTETSVPATGTQAALRVSWNAGTQTLTAEYDADGSANGYAWKVFKSFNPVSEGWNMAQPAGFQIFLRGYAEDTAVTTDQNVFADNFQLVAEHPVNLFGGDNFNDNSIDAAKWGSDEAEGDAALSETNGRLEYTTSGTGASWSVRPWIPNSGGYAEDWETSVDVHVGNVALPADGNDLRVFIGIDGVANHAGVQFEVKNVGGSPVRQFRWENEGAGGGGSSAPTIATDVSIRAAFTAATKVLAFYYDENGPVDGYSWTLLGSIDVDAPETNWAMTANSRFAVGIAGESEGILVNSGDAFADNFNAFGDFTAPVPTGFSGFDVFGAPAKDASKWGANVVEGSGQLTQSGDGVLRFSANGATDDDFMMWPWLAEAPFITSWSIQADVHMPVIPLADGHTAVGMGIAAMNSADSNDVFTSVLENYRNPSESQRFHFLNTLDINGNGEPETFAPTSSTYGAVRIAWDAATKILSAAYDADGPANGYSWTVFKTFNPATGGWDMTTAQKFKIFLGGSAELTAVSLGQNVYADNFYTFGIAGAPSTPVPPVVKTLAATNLSVDGAWLRGTVNAKGSPRTVYFDLGTTTAYGSTVIGAPEVVDGGGDTAVIAPIAGLLPHTKYNFRVRAAGLMGAAAGSNMTFTTDNSAPEPEDDAAVVVAGSIATIAVLDNDSDPDGDALTVASFTQPAASAGKVTKQGNLLLFAASGGFVAGEAEFTYTVKDGFGKSATATVTVTPGTAFIAPASLELGSEATTYEVDVNANGAWSATENLPWVTLGAPGGVGDGSVAIQVQANTGKTQRVGTVTIGGQTHTITQAFAVQLPVLTPPAVVPDGIVSGDYELLIETTGLPVKYTVTGAPPGLTLNPTTGILGGKPTKAGTYNISVKAANAAGAAAVSLNFTLIVRPLPDGAIGTFAGYIEPNVRLNDGLGSRVELTTTASGAVTGKLISGGVPLPFKGQLDAVLGDGSVNILVAVARKSGAFLALDLTIDSDTRAVIGELIEKGAPGTAVSSWDNIWNRAMAR